MGLKDLLSSAYRKKPKDFCKIETHCTRIQTSLYWKCNILPKKWKNIGDRKNATWIRIVPLYVKYQKILGAQATQQ